jgi:hypothetical protein
MAQRFFVNNLIQLLNTSRRPALPGITVQTRTIEESG